MVAHRSRIAGVGDEGRGLDALGLEGRDAGIEPLLAAPDQRDVETLGAELFGDAGRDAGSEPDDNNRLGHVWLSEAAADESMVHGSDHGWR